MNFSFVVETFCNTRVNSLVDLMLIWAIVVILFTMVLVKVNWMSAIGLVFVVCNRMCSIRVPWLMASCMLMINVYSSMFIVRFLVKDRSGFCLVCHY